MVNVKSRFQYFMSDITPYLLIDLLGYLPKLLVI